MLPAISSDRFDFVLCLNSAVGLSWQQRNSVWQQHKQNKSQSQLRPRALNAQSQTKKKPVEVQAAVMATAAVMAAAAAMAVPAVPAAAAVAAAAAERRRRRMH